MESLEEGKRYRCGACGNLTRFDVTVTKTTRYYHHQAISGEMTPEEEEVVSEHVDSVNCRWCGHGNAIEVIEGSDTG